MGGTRRAGYFSVLLLPVLLASEPPRTAGPLQVARDRKVIQDQHSGSWHVTLSCGQFLSLGQPAVDVVWQTPSGRKSSSKYQDGRFYFQLPNPVEGGEYSCIVPATDPELRATLWVNESQVRLTVLEAENTDLRTLVRSLGNKVKALEATTGSLEDKTGTLQDKTKSLQEIATRRAAFHARLSRSRIFNISKPVIPDSVLLNEGGAYSRTKGSFFVPYTGTYFLIVTTASGFAGDSAGIEMAVDEQSLCYAYSKFVNFYETSTCHVTVHLRAGQRVWLKSVVGRGNFFRSFTAFSGFLLRADE